MDFQLYRVACSRYTALAGGRKGAALSDRTRLKRMSMLAEALAGPFKQIFFLLSEVQRDPELRQQYAKQVLMPILQLLERYLKARIASGAF